MENGQLVIALLSAIVGGGIGALATVVLFQTRQALLSQTVRGLSAGLRTATRRLDLIMQLLLAVCRECNIDPKQTDTLFRLLAEGLSADARFYSEEFKI